MSSDWQNQPGQPSGTPPPEGAPAPSAWPPPAQTGWPPPPQAGWPPPPPGAQPGWTPAPGDQPGWPPTAGNPPPGYVPVYAVAPRYAGFWVRFGAYFIDVLIMLALTIVLFITIIGILLVLPLWVAYMPYLWWKRGATYGQKALGLRVVRAVDGGPIDGQTAFVRGLVMLAENAFSPIGTLGFVWAAFDSRKQAWHDLAAATVVIHAD